MVYNKKTWATGDTITATELNRIETGVSDIDAKKADKTQLETKADSSALTNMQIELSNARGVFGSLSEKLDNMSVAGGGTSVTDSETNGNIVVNGLELQVYDDTSINTALSGKEPIIVKGSAFNKDFGIIAGSVAEGNHTHTELHSHANKTTLDKLTDNGSNLLFNGSPIGGGASSGQLVATVVKNDLKEIVLTAIDIPSSTFTSPGHGLTNGMQVYPTLNQNAGAVYPPAVFPNTLVPGRYYVINATTDTFQLSTTNGGSVFAINVNGTMDLAKWHFEAQATSGNSLIASGLSAAKKYRAVLRYKVAVTDSMYFVPTNWDGKTGFLTDAGSAYTTPLLLTKRGTIAGIIEATFDATYKNTGLYKGMGVDHSSASANNIAMFNSAVISTVDGGVDITSITARHNIAFLNGTVLEIYSV